jgi:hypothetical protein
MNNYIAPMIVIAIPLIVSFFVRRLERMEHQLKTISSKVDRLVDKLAPEPRGG